MKRFFQTLPPRIKVGVIFFQMLLAAYYTTALTMINTPLGPYLTKYLGEVAIIYLGMFPLFHTLLEVCFGVKGTSPGEAKANQPPAPTMSKFGEIMPTKKPSQTDGNQS